MYSSFKISARLFKTAALKIMRILKILCDGSQVDLLSRMYICQLISHDRFHPVKSGKACAMACNKPGGIFLQLSIVLYTDVFSCKRSVQYSRTVFSVKKAVSGAVSFHFNVI
jgi:hypothetical protein